MRDWTVAGGLVETEAGILLVRNERPNGNCDWSPPGGVIDLDDTSIEAGLTREVLEETGLAVTEWSTPVYRVEAIAYDLEWRLRAQVHVALAFSGEVTLADPDGIVVDAAYVGTDALISYLDECAPWVREPLHDFLVARWDAPRDYAYDVRGTSYDAFTVVRRQP